METATLGPTPTHAQIDCINYIHTIMMFFDCQSPRDPKGLNSHRCPRIEEVEEDAPEFYSFTFSINQRYLGFWS